MSFEAKKKMDDAMPEGYKRIMKVGENSTFIATLLKDDDHTGFKKGFVFHPKGIHWTEDDKVVLVGEKFSDEHGNPIELRFPEDIVDVEASGEEE